MVITDSSMTKMGQVRFRKFGTFGKSYTEANALGQLKREACTINADVINIIKEKRVRLFSNAYRCTAEFYKLNKLDTLKSDERFDMINVDNRVGVDERKNSRNIKIMTAISLISLVSSAALAN